MISLALPAGAEPPVWGSFDASRVLSGRSLSGSDHDTLRDRISLQGGTLAAPTLTLTEAYLAGIDVFYTGPISDGAGDLSSQEQQALQSWVAQGGSLIVTVDINSTGSAADSILSPFGGALSGEPVYSASLAYPTGSHPIVDGITQIQVGTPIGLSPGTDMQVLATHGPANMVVAMVLESATGYAGLGRVAMFGDHNLFDDTFIPQNIQLADQLIAWAVPEPSTGALLMLGLGAIGAGSRRRPATRSGHRSPVGPEA
jgi:hypothetical protein